MVQAEELKELFDYTSSGMLVGKVVPWRRKESNSRVAGKVLGCPIKSGHLIVSFVDKRGVKHKELAHRVIYMMHHGELPDMLDHINRNPIDNRIENLRPATKALNSMNRGVQSNSKHGHRGIYQHPLTKSYGAYIKTSGKRVWLGSFTLLSDAIAARKHAEEIYWVDTRTDEKTTPY
jgi:hypothetical protein